MIILVSLSYEYEIGGVWAGLQLQRKRSLGLLHVGLKVFDTWVT